MLAAGPDLRADRYGLWNDLEGMPAAERDRALDDYLGRKKPLARHPAYARVRAGLPERATVLSLSEATSLLGPILFQYRVVAARWGGKEFGIPDLFRFAPHDGPDAAWLGMALVLEPGQVSFHLWAPVDALYEVHGLARSWFGADP